MSTPLLKPATPGPAELFSGVSREQARRRAASESLAAAADGNVILRLARYAPLMLVTTAAVLAGPATLAGTLVRPSSVPATVASAVLAGVLSAALTATLAWLWKRRSHASGDLLFAELLPWGFARHCYMELRLHAMRTAYGTAARPDEHGRVEQLEGLARLLAVREPHTLGHGRRVAHHAERIARALHLSPAEVAKVRTAALIHDIGKVYTPRAILNKPGALTAEEYEVVKRHAVDGAELICGAHDPELAEIVRHHHERLDGSGYPDALTGAQIPIGARVLAVADTFDALTSHRPYRRARSQREALAILRSERGTHLDADAVDAFIAGYCPPRSIASLATLSAFSASFGSELNLVPNLANAGVSAAGLLPALGAAGIAALSPGIVGNAPIAPASQRAATVRSTAARAAGTSLAQSGARLRSTTSPAGEHQLGRSWSRSRRRVASPLHGGALVPQRPATVTHVLPAAGGPAPGQPGGGAAVAGGGETPPVGAPISAPVEPKAGPPVTVPTAPPTPPPVTVPSVPPAPAPVGVTVPSVPVAGTVSTPSVTVTVPSVPTLPLPTGQRSSP